MHAGWFLHRSVGRREGSRVSGGSRLHAPCSLHLQPAKTHCSMPQHPRQWWTARRPHPAWGGQAGTARQVTLPAAAAAGSRCPAAAATNQPATHQVGVLQNNALQAGGLAGWRGAGGGGGGGAGLQRREGGGICDGRGFGDSSGGGLRVEDRGKAQLGVQGEQRVNAAQHGLPGRSQRRWHCRRWRHRPAQRAGGRLRVTAAAPLAELTSTQQPKPTSADTTTVAVWMLREMASAEATASAAAQEHEALAMALLAACAAGRRGTGGAWCSSAPWHGPV